MTKSDRLKVDVALITAEGNEVVSFEMCAKD